MWNRTIVSGTILTVILAGTAIGSSTAADAAVTCRPRIDGEGLGTSFFGQGTTVARGNAVNDWAHNVANKYGEKFSSISRAQQVRYDCAGGTVTTAKCVVAAIPCAETANPPARKGKRKKRRVRR